MPAEYKEDKTERATRRQRERAREQGNVAQSPEVGSALLLIFGLLTLYFSSSFMVRGMKEVLKQCFSRIGTYPITFSNFGAAMSQAIIVTLTILAPILIALVVIALASSYIQFGFLFTTKTLKLKLSSLKPSFKKLNPIQKENLVRFGIAVLKLTVITIVAYKCIRREIPALMQLADTSVSNIFSFACTLAFELILKIGVLFIIAAIADYIFKKHKHEESIKMTKQQVKDERKDLEGDPLVKGKIRTLQMKTAMQRMMKEVPEADVVITNPTHYAIAVKYNKDTMWAPKVVAKGVRLIAERIIQIAKENDIPCVENKPLAQALYKVVEVGRYIPAAFYHAVAEILAYIYSLKHNKAWV